MLEVSPGVVASRNANDLRVFAETDGRLFLFNPRTGVWDDIYARAIEDTPAEGAK